MILSFDNNIPHEIAGRKGHNLSLMWQKGLPVPPGFCLTCDEIENVSPFELSRALDALGAASYAVRSSAIQEDSADASFAGMLTSRLNITSHASVLAALQEVRDSASTPATLGYSDRLNLPHAIRIAAVVQAFIPAEASGVLFMRDPRTSVCQFVVEGSWGLGPGVVDGLVQPDRWILATDGTVISSYIADKDTAMVPRQPEGTTAIPVDPPCRRRPCLTTDSLRELAQLAVECERLFGGPQDIEWGVYDNRVWLLQSRPIACNRLS